MHWTSHDIEAAVGAATAVSGAAAITYRKLLKPLGNFLQDWHGTPARPGVPRRPGVMERLQTVEDRTVVVNEQLRPNGGSSMYDKVTQVANQMDAQSSASGTNIHIHTDGASRD